VTRPIVGGRLLEALLVAWCAIAATVVQADPWQGRGAVFTMSNAPSGNSVIAFARDADGRLSNGGEFATGGLGSGGGLGNHGAIALDDDGRLFVVNAGSNEISMFLVRGTRLKLLQKVSSGGDRPVSLTIDDDVLYVLNAGSDSIKGFRVTWWGGLTPIPRSTRPLSGTGTGPAQISFAPDGRTLVITEKATNNLVLYGVDEWGRPRPTPTVVPSAGATPFGFGFNGRRQLIVSEAFGGAAGQSAVSSYLLRRNGTLDVVSASVPSAQTAACWIVATPNRLFAYTTNTGSGTISGYRVGPGGTLTRFDDGGVTANLGAGSGPIDMAITWDGEFLYALNGGNGTISLMRVHHDGTLAVVDTTAGLPSSANGLAAF
jgi:6-phosphogluconolactonase